MKAFLGAVLFLGVPFSAQAKTWLCENYDVCGSGGNRPNTSAPAQPTVNSTIHINPAAVPTADTAGVEAIYYKGLFDFALVKGLGRVGAAISPSNNEETFFGPPAFESASDFVIRKENHNKLPSQKVTLATAFNVYSNKKHGLKKFDLNLGVLAKYNKISYEITPGGGLSGNAGPFTFGYSASADSFIPNKELYDIDASSIYRYSVETYSAGIFLDSVALDYSEQRVYLKDRDDRAEISMLTGSLLLQKAIVTLALRREVSDRPYYNYEKNMVENRKTKEAVFTGVQFVVHKNIMVGGFYNYYLLNEISLGATAFF